MDPLFNNTPTKVARFLVSGHFRIQRLEEASALAEFLGSVCPHPHLSIVTISELLVNAIEHGNLGITAEEKLRLQKQNQWIPEIDRRLTLPKHKHQYVHVNVTLYDTEIKLNITDDGNGFDWKTYTNPAIKHDSRSSQGRGILLAENLGVKSLEYSEKGNVVTCIISLV